MSFGVFNRVITHFIVGCFAAMAFAFFTPDFVWELLADQKNSSSPDSSRLHGIVLRFEKFDKLKPIILGVPLLIIAGLIVASVSSVFAQTSRCTSARLLGKDGEWIPRRLARRFKYSRKVSIAAVQSKGPLRSPSSLMGSPLAAILLLKSKSWLHANELLNSVIREFTVHDSYRHSPCVIKWADIMRRKKRDLEKYEEWLPADPTGEDVDGMAVALFMRTGNQANQARWIRFRGVYRVPRHCAIIILFWVPWLALRPARWCGPGSLDIVILSAGLLLVAYLLLMYSKTTELLAARLIARATLLTLLEDNRRSKLARQPPGMPPWYRL